MPNPYQVPIEQRKDDEFRSFAKTCVIAILAGLVLAAVICTTQWGF